MKRFILLSFFILLTSSIILLYPLVKIIQPFIPFTDYLLGTNNPTSYLILLGNDTEMRANGGFAGSYAKIILSPNQASTATSVILAKAGIHPINPDISFQDIYVPNGQLSGHVKPPEQIQQAFGHGTWELANADWEPDFPSASEDLRWFLEKGKEINPDILGIVNLTTIKKVLDIVGDFSVPEYKAQITPENLYLFLQGKTEVDFFPGSTQKKDTLTAVGQAMIKKAKVLPLNKKIKIAKILYTDLVNQNIVLNSSSESFQTLLEEKKFAGTLSPKAFDNYALIETNLGANKANQFVTRDTKHDISFSNNLIHHKTSIHFSNSSPEANPHPPLYYGGNYITYLRIYVSPSAQNISLVRNPVGSPPVPILSPETKSANSNSVIAIGASAQSPIVISNQILDPDTQIDPVIDYHLNSKYGFTEIGFWHTTPAGGVSTIDLSYDLPLTNQADYSLAILKQNGFPTSPQSISLFGKSHSTTLTSSFFLH